MQDLHEQTSVSDDGSVDYTAPPQYASAPSEESQGDSELGAADQEQIELRAADDDADVMPELLSAAADMKTELDDLSATEKSRMWRNATSLLGLRIAPRKAMQIAAGMVRNERQPGLEKLGQMIGQGVRNESVPNRKSTGFMSRTSLHQWHTQ